MPVRTWHRGPGATADVDEKRTERVAKRLPHGLLQLGHCSGEPGPNRVDPRGTCDSRVQPWETARLSKRHVCSYVPHPGHGSGRTSQPGSQKLGRPRHRSCSGPAQRGGSSAGDQGRIGGAALDASTGGRRERRHPAPHRKQRSLLAQRPALLPRVRLEREFSSTLGHEDDILSIGRGEGERGCKARKSSGGSESAISRVSAQPFGSAACERDELR